MPSSHTVRAVVAASLALVLGAGACVGLFVVLDDYQQRLTESRQPEDTVMAIVAARELYPGIPISEDDLIAIELPPRLLPEGVFLTPEHVVGQRPKERILANELVRSDRLANPGNGDGLNTIIPRQMRAISVELADGPALSGFLDPGNSVDMLVTLDPESEQGARRDVETHLLLQSLFVLGVNGVAQAQSSDAIDPEKRPSVTLLVTAEQAEQVAHAETVGELRLTLRNDEDKGWVGSSGVGIGDLIEVLTPPPPRVRVRPPVVEAPAEAAQGTPIWVINGPDAQQIEVPIEDTDDTDTPSNPN